MNLMLKHPSYWILAALIAMAGCSGGGKKNTGTSDSASLNEQADAAARSPLFIKIDTQYASESGAGTGTVTTHGYCYIDPDNLAANNINCTVTIPEGQLHYSRTKLTVGTSSSTSCPRILFVPYVRRLEVNTNATFTPPFKTDDVDCTDPEEAGCWAGAALDINADFPKHFGRWFPTAVSTSNEFELKSSWESEDGMGNTHVTNNLVARGANVVVGGNKYYDATTSSYYDYKAYCQDSWEGTLFSITMKIADEDTQTVDPDAVNDEWYDWAP